MEANSPRVRVTAAQKDPQLQPIPAILCEVFLNNILELGGNSSAHQVRKDFWGCLEVCKRRTTRCRMQEAIPKSGPSR